MRSVTNIKNGPNIFIICTTPNSNCEYYNAINRMYTFIKRHDSRSWILFFTQNEIFCFYEQFVEQVSLLFQKKSGKKIYENCFRPISSLCWKLQISHYNNYIQNEIGTFSGMLMLLTNYWRVNWALLKEIRFLQLLCKHIFPFGREAI